MNLCRLLRHQTGEKPKNRSSQKKRQVCSKSCGKIYRHFRKIHSAWKLSANTQRVEKLLQKKLRNFCVYSEEFHNFQGCFVIFHIKGFISPVPNTNFFDCIFHFFSNDAPQNLVSAMILAQNQKNRFFSNFPEIRFCAPNFSVLGYWWLVIVLVTSQSQKKLRKS